MFGCNNNQNTFNGKFVHINKPESISVNVQKLDLVAPGAVTLYVVDTFLLMYTPNNDCLLSIYSLNNLSKIGDYITKGKGSNEFLYLTVIDNGSTTHNGDVELQLLNDNQQSVISFDILESINQGRAVLCDTIMLNSNDKYKYNQIYYTNDSLLIGEANSELITIDRTNMSTRSAFSLYSLSDYDFSVTFGVKAVKPDGTKWVQVMMLLNQVNICNIDGSDAKSVSFTKKMINPKSIKPSDSPMAMDVYYRDVKTTNNSIICCYLPNSDASTELQFFDWNGSVKYVLKLDCHIPYISVDEVNKVIYGFTNDDEFYKIPLPEEVKNSI